MALFFTYKGSLPIQQESDRLTAGEFKTIFRVIDYTNLTSIRKSKRSLLWPVATSMGAKADLASKQGCRQSRPIYE
jgi:hypothetical protein